jgi:hypothetical protein
VIGEFGVATIGDALGLRLADVSRLGDDLRVVAEMPYDAAGSNDTAGVQL